VKGTGCPLPLAGPFGRRIAVRSHTGPEDPTGSVRYILADHLASSTHIVDSGGTLLESVKYYPYGSVREGSMPLTLTDKEFTGQQEEGTAFGLYDYGARFYSTLSGRFVSADPIVQDTFDPQMLDHYSYVRNNPLRYVDPTGLSYVPPPDYGEPATIWEQLDQWYQDLLGLGFSHEGALSYMSNTAYWLEFYMDAAAQAEAEGIPIANDPEVARLWLKELKRGCPECFGLPGKPPSGPRPGWEKGEGVGIIGRPNPTGECPPSLCPLSPVIGLSDEMIFWWEYSVEQMEHSKKAGLTAHEIALMPWSPEQRVHIVEYRFSEELAPDVAKLWGIIRDWRPGGVSP
jgi:RHS repeat-associated protein